MRVGGAASVAEFWERDTAPRRHEEESFQRALVTFLQIALPHDAMYFHVPNGGPSKKVNGRRKGLGVVAGVPDLCVIHRGRALFLELKAKRGVVSSAQRNLHKLLVHCGAEVMTVRSVPEAEAALREACVPLRAAVAA
jgi:hypothetical protein